MWVHNSKLSKIVNLDYCSEVCIAAANVDKGLYEICAFAEDKPAIPLTSLCSLDHAKKQFSSILHSLSRDAAVCRVYNEDDLAASNGKE